MPTEPGVKRAFAFIDGQNLFHSVKESFGYQFPNYDVDALARAVCQVLSWKLEAIFFYTGIPEDTDDRFWNSFWTSKLSGMGRQNITVYSRNLKYRNQTVRLPDNSTHSILVGQEKGIDIRIALDVVRSARKNLCDAIVIFSQDQDLSEVADEIRTIAEDQNRWIKVASAFPFSPTTRNRRGINHTDWFRIDRKLYDSCIDPRDYRPKNQNP